MAYEAKVKMAQTVKAKAGESKASCGTKAATPAPAPAPAEVKAPATEDKPAASEQVRRVWGQQWVEVDPLGVGEGGGLGQWRRGSE